MSSWEWTVRSGNDDYDRQTVEGHRQQAAAQGMHLQVTPMPGGGYHLKAVPAQGAQPQQAWGQPQQQAQAGWGQPQQPAQQQPVQQQQAWGQPQMAAAMAGGPAGVGVAGGAAPAASTGQQAAALTPDRVRYLRKVYGLLSVAAFIAIAVGYATLELSPTMRMVSPRGQPANVPILVGLMLQSRVIMYAAWAVLVGATFVASWVSKVRVLNVLALFGVSALMGIELAPMVFVAQFYAGLGQTMSSAPVRDAFAMVAAVFIGITAYVFVTRKDFSYLAASLSMGFFVIFGASILAIFLHSEVFSLAVASAGALLSAGFLLFQTSYIFRNSDMDDPVDDALVLLVQLRNLFMFLLRIFMSSRD